MATYNGENYLAEQIESIMTQSNSEWHLYVHDDGSKDKTTAILQEYAARYSDKVTILDYESQGGACRNFMSMLQRVDYEYYMFSDQDDIWMPRKIENTLSALQSKEKEVGNAKPIVVCTNLHVVDNDHNTIAASMWDYMNISPSLLNDFNMMAGNNIATGCTMMINQAAKQSIVMPMTYATMHDAWILLCALKNGGEMVAISEPQIYYRQHSNNQVGATDYSELGIIYRVRKFKRVYGICSSHYRMLASLGYGSVFKFIWYKILYKYKSRKLRDQKSIC